MEIGFLVFAVLSIMGGLIAFLGDKIGSKVGKKRISLFGMRPKHTSILVTIMTGIMIAVMTVGVLSALSENVRTALFGMEQLRERMADLTREVDTKTAELAAGKKQLAAMSAEYADMTERVRTANAELARAEVQEREMRAQLRLVEESLAQAHTQLNLSAEEIRALEETRATLNDNIDKLNREAERLRDSIISIREGQVVFRVGEVLTGAVVESKLTEEQTAQVLASILNDTNNLILRRFGVKEDQTIVRVTPEEFERAKALVQGSENKKYLRIVSIGNIIYGEPAWVAFEVHDNALIYRKGDVVHRVEINATGEPGEIQMQVLQFLQDVNRAAQRQGVLPDPISGNVGQLDGQQLFATIRDVQESRGRVLLTAVAKTDIYTEGPVRIDITVRHY
ncbi:MAG: DUF3084 domain-containing protein [Veillonellaceae bacterium]|nr:DUF3084 domain-containing protein [Veillonellaceae bacterium]